jgi:hypothetical protein
MLAVYLCDHIASSHFCLYYQFKRSQKQKGVDTSSTSWSTFSLPF